MSSRVVHLDIFVDFRVKLALIQEVVRPGGQRVKVSSAMTLRLVIRLRIITFADQSLSAANLLHYTHDNLVYPLPPPPPSPALSYGYQTELSALKLPFGETEQFSLGENLDSFFKLKSPQTIPSCSSDCHGRRRQENDRGNIMTTITRTSPEDNEGGNSRHAHQHGVEGDSSDGEASCSASSSGSVVEKAAVVPIESPSPLSPTVKKKGEKKGISRKHRGRDRPRNINNCAAASVSPQMAALFRAPLLMDAPSAAGRPTIAGVAAAAAVAGLGRTGRKRLDHYQ